MCQVFICGVQSEIKGVRQKIWACTKVPNLMTHVGRGDFHTLNTIMSCGKQILSILSEIKVNKNTPSQHSQYYGRKEKSN